MKNNFEISYNRLKEIVYSSDNKEKHQKSLLNCVELVKKQYYEHSIPKSQLKVKEFDDMKLHINKIK